MQTHQTRTVRDNAGLTSTIVANTSTSLATGMSWVRTRTCCGPGGIAGIPTACCLRTSRRIGHNGTHITTFDSPDR
jgi:hypothetical protein